MNTLADGASPRIDAPSTPVAGVALHLIDLRLDPQLGPQALAADERERHARFRDPLVARRWLRCRLALRRILADAVATPQSAIGFAVGRYGRPSLRCATMPAPLEFSLSHAGDWACVAWSREHRVGVDLECLRPIDDVGALARLALTADERRLLETAAPAHRPALFLRLWTRKEAVLKAAGLGLNDRLPMHRLDVRDAVARAPADEDSDSPVGWRLHDIAGPAGTLVALAVPQPPPARARCDAGSSPVQR